MIRCRNKLYAFVLLACSSGYMWLYYHISTNLNENSSGEVCMLKSVTGVPCPSCGSTRSVVALLEGNFFEALSLNPIGYILAIGLFVLPIWIVSDLLMSRQSFFDFFRSAELFLQKPKHYLPLALLVVINWVWTITKGL